jgi:peptide-methionine (S)-S-oxide reductase
MPGYTGGTTVDPTYEEVSSGETGHAESIQIEFDPEIIDYSALLDVFWHTHDPTTLNRQGNDVGTQYRSAVFYHDELQKEKALAMKVKLEKAGEFDGPIVTEVTQVSTFYPAEEYHRNFYESGRRPDYCRIVIDPKIKKLLREYTNIVNNPQS